MGRIRVEAKSPLFGQERNRESDFCKIGRRTRSGRAWNFAGSRRRRDGTDQNHKKSSASEGRRRSGPRQGKCSTCHYDTSDAKKIGPGLKGIGKRGTFTVNNNKVTDETLKTWIENGDSLMPPFKDVIEDAQIKDVIAYVKTL